MLRPAVAAGRTLLRQSSLRPSLARPVTTNTTRSFSSAASKKSSFKSTAARWALAGGIVYWYATSNVFADEPKYFSEEPNTTPRNDEDRPPSLLPEKSLRSRGSTLKTSGAEDDRLINASDAITTKDRGTEIGESHEIATHPRGPEELEEEASQEGAFNPETGEINWDCPCLGGMAHGPCGEEFKTAFSCFVFSTEDPKGVDCIDKFKGMQTCFQQHPEVYGSELDGDDDDGEELDPTEKADKASEISTDSATNNDSEMPSSKPLNRPTETPATTGKAHTSHPEAQSSPTAGAARGAPAPPAGTAYSDPIAGTKTNPKAGASRDKETGGNAHSSPTWHATSGTEPEGATKRGLKPAGLDLEEERVKREGA